jgi:hypothetical protein
MDDCHFGNIENLSKKNPLIFATTSKIVFRKIKK